MSEKTYSIFELEPLFEFLNGELKPKENAKKERGEVFTPFSIVNDMLDRLNESYKKIHNKSIFTEKHLKWFDPAAGIGNFPVIIYQRLMLGLDNDFPDNETRRRHILQNMIYSSELSPQNITTYKYIFCSEHYKLNLYQGDSLVMDVKDAFRLSEDFNGFDIVIGNPPYNEDGTKHLGNKNIYVYFSKKAFELWLKKSGFLAYIHPPTYRIPNHKIQHTKTNLNEIYTGKNILCIKMYSIPETLKLMYVMINVDFIILQNDDWCNGITHIIDIDKNEYKISVKPNDFIPNYGLDIMEKIRIKSQLGTNELILDSQLHAQKTRGTTYKNVHGITRKGIKICMSDEPYKHLEKRKLIINGIGSYNYVFYDEAGEYGITQSPMTILEPSENTLRFIQSPLFHFITNATKIIGNNLNKKTSLFLPIIPTDTIITTNDELYDYFEFTPKEVDMIKCFKIPEYISIFLSKTGKNSLDEMI